MRRRFWAGVILAGFAFGAASVVAQEAKRAERPDEYAGRRVECVPPQELARLVEQRQQQTIERALHDTRVIPIAAGPHPAPPIRQYVGDARGHWEGTIDDSHTWARPWTFAMHLTEDHTQAPFEYACHEGNYGLRNILAVARAEDRAKTADVK